MRTLTPDEMVRHLWKVAAPDRHERIFALLDAARHDSIFPAVMGADCQIACLYRDVPDPLFRVAPYLVELKQGSAFAFWLFSRWGDHWGILLATRARLDELYRHFRRFLIVRDETGRRLYFRYYDPRVLREYLPTCTQSELESVFGPVDRYWVEGGQVGEMTEYTRSVSGLRRRVIHPAGLPEAEERTPISEAVSGEN